MLADIEQVHTHIKK
ncbi:MAG: hypothetical protein EZS28_012376, partial [Streblomastix strix]